MVKKVFVVLPFCIEDFMETDTKLARKAEEHIGCYCAVIHLIKNNRDALQLLSDSILAMRSAETVIFTRDWQDYPECVMLHDIAEYYKRNILELDAEAKEKQKTKELIPCPFCGDNEALVVANKQTEHGKEYTVWCSNCGISGPASNNEQRAINMWNNRGAEE